MTIESGVVELEEQATTEQYGTTTDDDCPAETSSSDDAAGTATATENSDSDDDDDDHTVIVLEQGMDNEHQAPSVWADQNSPEMEERRRNVLLRELQRVQRASFIHFLILCLIPTSLLFIVIATVLGEDEECESVATTCEKEARTFINAFTTRCVCEAIVVVRGDP